MSLSLVPSARASRVDIALFEMRCCESALSKLSVNRRRANICEPIIKRIKADLRYVFRQECARVVDLLLKHGKLPYTPGKRAAAVEGPFDPDLESLMSVLINGQSIPQYESVLEDGYLEVMPKAMDAARKQVLDASGKPYRVTSAGDLLLANGMKLVRQPGAENWIRDHAIVFGRKYAHKIPATTNKAIRSELSAGMAEFEPMSKLAARVQDVYKAASDYRADMIARAESARGYGAAGFATAKAMGANGHHWIVSGSPWSLSDICGTNAAMGVIGLGEPFYDTEGNPIQHVPAHPNCECNDAYDLGADWEIPESMMEAVESVEDGDGHWVTINGAHVLLGDDNSGGASGGDATEPVGTTSWRAGSTAMALEMYQEAGYETLNKSLRDGTSGVENEADRMDGAFVHHGETLESDRLVFRGGRDLFVGESDASIVGATIQDKAFVSTSTDRGAAEEFARGNHVLYEINLPRGSRVIDMDKAVKGKDFREHEILLRRGANFRVVGRTSRGYKLEYVKRH